MFVMVAEAPFLRFPLTETIGEAAHGNGHTDHHIIRSRSSHGDNDMDRRTMCLDEERNH
jgi:hypothetical protein